MTDQSLFSEFPKVSVKEWKQKIQYDLKGKDYNESLVWESLEGIKVKPFYSDEDSNHEKGFEIAENHNWSLAQPIYVNDSDSANEKALHILQSGVESLIFNIADDKVTWDVLLADIDLSKVPLHFELNVLDLEVIKSLLDFVEGKKARLYLNIDLIGNLARTGNWYYDQNKDYQVLEAIHKLCEEKPGVTVLSVDVSLYQNAGANMVQQLAYALSHANEYLNHFASKAKQSPTVVFKVAIGGNYFFEIAKIRALRWLWKISAAEYGIKSDGYIMAVPSRRNKSIYDYNVNQLRTTTECMSAILGGADAICNLPYDALYKKNNEFSERIARNQLLVLRNESYFSEIADAVNGTYYIESLTQQLADRGLQLFKSIEKGGGFVAQLKEGTVQKKLQESAEKEQHLFDTGKLTLVGGNKYQNEADQMAEQLELYPFLKTNKRKTIVEPIIEKRLAEPLEKERLSKEKGN